MNPLLGVHELSIDVGAGPDRHRVVDDLSLEVFPGECLGLAGESGSGKSLTLRSIIGLLPRGAHMTSGQLTLEGKAYQPARMRGHGIAMIFQEPMTALNPTRRVGAIIADGVRSADHWTTPQAVARKRAVELMREVGIPDPAGRARAYPHELSGGLRQRVMIALALATEPRLLICDEPTTALDVTVQGQILRLLDRLRSDHGLAMLFVTHDLGVIAQISQRIAVMRSGTIVEQGETRAVLSAPEHDYTRSLCAAAKALDERRPDPMVSSC